MAAFYTLLYIAELADAEALVSDEDADERWPSIWLKHLGSLELVQLWDIIRKQPYDPSHSMWGEYVFKGGDEGPFVIKMAESFVTSLAELPEERVAEVAGLWGKLEELSDWNPDELANVLSNLRAFMLRAVESGKPVLEVACL